MKFKLNKNLVGISIFSSEKTDGLMAQDSAKGRENTRIFLKKNNITSPFSHMAQVHKSEIAVVSRAGIFEGTDGLISNGNYALAVKSADCIPVMVFDPKTKIICAIHAGRKSITLAILSESMKTALLRHSSDPKDAHVFLGPHIRVRNYGLGLDMAEDLKATGWGKFLVKFGPDYHFDLTAAVKDELVKIGVKAENILDCGIDTFEDNRFFSARKNHQNRSERFLTVIVKNES